MLVVLITPGKVIYRKDSEVTMKNTHTKCIEEIYMTTNQCRYSGVRFITL